MEKFDKSQTKNPANPDKMARFPFSEEYEDDEFDDRSYNSKVKVECICPKCGQRHVLAFHWIGRGTPRKYCQTCKGGSHG